MKKIALEFSDEAASRLEKMKKKAETNSDAEVIRNALRVYEWCMAQTEAGYELGLYKDGVPVRAVQFWLE